MTYTAGLAERVGWVQCRCHDLVRNVEYFIHGKTHVVWNAVTCLLATGTQFTPDLLPHRRHWAMDRLA